MKQVICLISLSCALCVSCFPENQKGKTVPAPFTPPATIPSEILASIEANQGEFMADLNSLMENDDEGLLILVDKRHSLNSGYAPDDLVPLSKDRSYTVSRDGLKLRAIAEAALEQMAEAARRSGIVLVASSAYRSYEYQKTVYDRNVRELGQAAADRESARPGTSQHQLGLALDFGSITDEFARTAAGRWLVRNAADYGWSLSFPDGYEAVTGYRWESWHYRFVGVEAAAFQKKWFGDVQQYMMEYLAAWKSYRTY